jgi:hypothetical protein
VQCHPLPPCCAALASAWAVSAAVHQAEAWPSCRAVAVEAEEAAAHLASHQQSATTEACQQLCAQVQTGQHCHRLVA